MAASSPFKNDHTMSNEFSREATSFRNKQGGNTIPPILVLSANPNVLDTVKRSVPTNATVVEAPNVDGAMQQLYSARPGVVLLDSMACKDIPGTIAQMMQEIPNL